ncbi:Transcriptional regulatory protein DevR [Nitrospira sp. KM1]|uniref:response regulator transcription factor n=1 Tax=Nitrospira sp. KM1 TaxID=1936990 RepID=UPI0013A75261|nr:response regulator transcription factor [Nitrospira sp. KM1]BCA55729.1 Transcriptional regulatory protein DevR [Nitrospira sp. KM1]
MDAQKSKVIRLLIVDDHEVVRIGLGAVLGLTPGIKVVGQAAGKEEARTMSLRLKPDVVLLDIRLPDGSGVEAAREILSSCPGTKVLFLTSFADDHTVLEAILSGAHGYVLKDIASDALIRAIRTVACGQPLVDPRLTKYGVQWLKQSSASGGPSKRPLLSPQEQRLLPLVADGMTNKEIAGQLNLSEKTVKNYLANIYSKLQIGRRSQVAALYAGSFKAPSSRADVT